MAETWRVVSQRQSEELNPAGTGFETYWIVTYEVTSGPGQGSTGRVRIPVSQYTVENVSDVIEAQVGQVNAVAGL